MRREGGKEGRGVGKGGRKGGEAVQNVNYSEFRKLFLIMEILIAAELFMKSGKRCRLQNLATSQKLQTRRFLYPHFPSLEGLDRS